MNILSERIRKLKIFFICGAILIAGASLIYSHTLIRDLYAEEVSKMEVWAEAMRSLTVADETTDLNLVLKVINSNHTIPVIVTDSQDNVLAWRNLSNAPQGSDSLQILRSQLQRICQEGDSMKVEIPHDSLCVHYEESVLLHRLSLFPYVQLSIVFVFVVIAFMALMAFKRAEQNRVWVGLSRETAHQLGTPISSIMAWIEVLRETYPEDELLPEMANDVQRLQLIAERFSKIGSAPELTVQDLCPVVTRVANYMDRRTSKKVSITVVPPPHPLPFASMLLCLSGSLKISAATPWMPCMVRAASRFVSVPLQRGLTLSSLTREREFPANISKPFFAPASPPNKEGGGLVSPWRVASSANTTADASTSNPASRASAPPSPLIFTNLFEAITLPNR